MFVQNPLEIWKTVLYNYANKVHEYNEKTFTNHRKCTKIEDVHERYTNEIQKRDSMTK